jgi:hypothetical protein
MSKAGERAVAEHPNVGLLRFWGDQRVFDEFGI